jgi:hypothetical protein
VTGLVRAEWTKLFTTRTWAGLLLGACLLVGGFTALTVAFAGVARGEQAFPPVQDPAFQKLALAVSGNGTVLLLVLGVIGTTQEYRHRTATPTFLTTPRRGRVVVAKLVAYALAAVPFAVVVLGVNLLVLETYARARGGPPSLDGDQLRIIAGAGVGMVVYTVIGVGVGALLRNQVGAIVGSLVYLFVVEQLVRGIPALSGAFRWLPGGALQALTTTAEGSPDVLAPWQGAVLLLGYGLLAALLGTLLTVRRDVV